MAAVTIRPATRDDIQAMLTIAAELHEWFARGVPKLMQLDCARRNGLVAVDETGVVVGFLLWRCQEIDCWIEWLAVARAHHRQGIGRALIDRLIGMARDCGAKFITTATVMPPREDHPYHGTVAFYEALGFELQKIDRAGWPDGTDRAEYLLFIKATS